MPGHWEVRKLTHIFEKFGSGTTPDSSNSQYFYNGTINWLLTGDLNEGILNECSSKVTSKALADYSPLRIYPKGSLAVAMYGATIGKCSILNIEACTNQACCVMYQSKVALVVYVFYWFLACRKEIVNLAYGGGQPNISQAVIKGLRIPVPPLVEQADIVAHIERESERINKLMNTAKKQIAYMQEYRQAMIAESVTGGLSRPKRVYQNAQKIGL